MTLSPKEPLSELPMLWNQSETAEQAKINIPKHVIPVCVGSFFHIQVFKLGNV